MPAQPVTILNSEAHLLDSQHTGRQYRMTVSLPLGYAASPGERWPFNDLPAQWPTVYVLDGNWYAGMVAGIIRPMAWCGSTTDAIVVGIGYPEDDDPIESTLVSFTRRDHDLTPIPDDETQRGMEAFHQRPVPNGDAANFHRFMRDELIPFVETTYRADPSRRILAGHSYGGLFALFGMFETPDLFETLIIGSPTLEYRKPYLLEREADFARTHRQLPVKMYLFAGELEESIEDETLTNTLRLAAILQGRHYAGFSLLKHVFPDQNHCEVAAPGFQWGLKAALRK